MSTRHAAVRPSVELLAPRASDHRPRGHAAVRLSVELLALRASDRRPRRHAAVRLSVELLALRASDRRPRRHAAIRLSVEHLALRAPGRGLLRRHAPALRKDEGLAGRANILGRCHWNECRSYTQRGEYKAHAKEQEKRRCLPIHYALPVERPRKPEMTDRQSRSRQRPYHTATAVRDRSPTAR